MSSHVISRLKTPVCLGFVAGLLWAFMIFVNNSGSWNVQYASRFVKSVQTFVNTRTEKSQFSTHDLQSFTEASQSPTQGALIQDPSNPPESLNNTPYFRLIPHGDNIQAGRLQVHIAAAFQYPASPHLPAGRQTIFLNGWARHNTPTTFKCCLTTSLTSRAADVTETDVEVYHEYTQWLVDMQAVEFTCMTNTSQEFRHVTFAQTSCSAAPRDVMAVAHPRGQPGAVGVCLKISYGALNVSHVAEWFEYQRLMNVTSVFTYHHNLTSDVMDVLRHYQNEGLLDTWPIQPAVKEGGLPRGFTQPRYDEQAWVDEVMACNHCKHLMAGFDYVIVMDMDEVIVPNGGSRGGPKSYLDILKMTSRRDPKAAAFRLDAHVVVLDWKVTRHAPLFMTSYVNRTSWANYDGAAMNTRWGFSPKRVRFVQNNRAWPKPDYTTAHVSTTLFTLLHFRHCKPHWEDCLTTPRRVTDLSMVRYEEQLVSRLLALPKTLLGGEAFYLQGLNEWWNSWNKRRLKMTLSLARPGRLNLPA